MRHASNVMRQTSFAICSASSAVRQFAFPQRGSNRKERKGSWIRPLRSLRPLRLLLPPGSGDAHKHAGLQFRPDYDEDQPVSLRTDIFSAFGIEVNVP